ncbi:MAG: hypothetical protein ACFFBP_12385 [Promethearchaeota archaeon]
MKIFEWVKEIEDVYDKLIEKAKIENENSLEAFKKQQLETINLNQKKNSEFMDSTMKIISEEINNGLKKHTDEFTKALENVKNDYYKNKKKLIEKIINQFGFDFE